MARQRLAEDIEFAAHASGFYGTFKPALIRHADGTVEQVDIYIVDEKKPWTPFD